MPRPVMIKTILLKVLLTATVAIARPSQSRGALYSMTNDPAGNSIILNSIGSDGLLTYAGFVPTGGKGLHDNPGETPIADPFFSSKCMKVIGKQLFLVNAGSNTISMFAINPHNPLDLKMVGKPISSGGEFPVSLDMNPKTGDVCVLNGGKVNGVACFKVDPARGLKSNNQFFSLGLNQTTPPTGPQHTVSHVLFSSDGTKLRVSVKGTLAQPIDFGYVTTWDVGHDGKLSSNSVKTTPTPGNGIIPFGMTNLVDAKDAVMVTDPGLGLVIYDFTKSPVAFSPLTINGQVAACWAEYSTVTSSYWVSDLDANRVYEVSVQKGSFKPALLSTFDLAFNNNSTDIAIGAVSNKQYLYALSPAVSSINIFSLKKGHSNLTATYDFGAASAKDLKFNGNNLAGAALYMV